MIKILQGNMNRSRTAHDLANALALRTKADVVMVSEPNGKVVGKGWTKDPRGNVAIKFLGKKCKIQGIRTLPGILMADLEWATLMAVYISPNMPRGEAENRVDEIFEIIRGIQGGLILLGDVNAKAVEWGSPATDKRGERIIEGIAAQDMVVINSGGVPTCVRPNGVSHVDITVATRGIARRITGWEVHEKEVYSYHRSITFQVSGGPGRTDAGNGVQRNRIDLERLKETLRIRVQERLEDSMGCTPEQCVNLLKEAKREIDDGGPSRRKTQPYWWAVEVEETWKRSTRLGRRLIRRRQMEP